MDKDDLYELFVTRSPVSDEEDDFVELEHLFNIIGKDERDEDGGLKSINLIMTDDTTITDIVETDIPNLL
jgi:hypothetical protein